MLGDEQVEWVLVYEKKIGGQPYEATHVTELSDGELWRHTTILTNHAPAISMVYIPDVNSMHETKPPTSD